MNSAEIRLFFPPLKVPQVVGSFPIGYFVTANMTTWRWFTDAKIWRAEQICVPDTIRWERRNSRPQVISTKTPTYSGAHYLPHAAANFNNRRGRETHLKMQMDEKIKHMILDQPPPTSARFLLELVLLAYSQQIVCLLVQLSACVAESLWVVSKDGFGNDPWNSDTWPF